jgi:plastocyanin
MAKKRTRAAAKKTSRQSSHTDDKSFLIIVAGGFLVVMFALFFVGDRSFKNFVHRPMTGMQQMGSHTVVIKDYATDPATLYIKSGESVSWANQDEVTHTISATNNSFTTGPIYQGGQGSFTFAKPGVYQYYSTSYPNVRGVVYVE